MTLLPAFRTPLLLVVTWSSLDMRVRTYSCKVLCHVQLISLGGLLLSEGKYRFLQNL